jgi:3-oxoacyl-[acyl-carrier-protein] synthase II
MVKAFPGGFHRSSFEGFEMHKRVVVIGMASVNPLGCNYAQILAGLRAGRSAAGILDLFPAASFPNQVVAQVAKAPLESLIRDLPGSHDWANERKIVIGIAAICELFKTGQFQFHDLDWALKGISLGIGINQIDFRQLSAYFALKKEDKLQYFYRDIIKNQQPTQYSPDFLARWIGQYYNFHGPTLNNLSACAASTQAIGTAFRWIKRGKAKLVLTGGIDSILNPIGISGFSILGTLSAKNEQPATASRPFDSNRDGFVPGEGAGVLLLAELEYALHNGAKIYGEIFGYGSSMDAYKVTAPCSDGAGAALAMKNAMREAGWTAKDVQYINAHGTSTYLNDMVETRAIKNVFGDLTVEIPVSSCKSQFGHLIAASGAVETIACLMAINAGFIPPNINYETPDPECNLNVVSKAQPAKVSRFLKNSLALGGQNATLALGAFEG